MATATALRTLGAAVGPTAGSAEEKAEEVETPSCLGAISADLALQLLQHLDVQLLPLLGQRPEYAQPKQRLPIDPALIEALIEQHLSSATPGWENLLAEARGASSTASSVASAARKNGLYPALALLGHAGRERLVGRAGAGAANCALAPVGGPVDATALAAFTTRAVPRGGELVLP